MNRFVKENGQSVLFDSPERDVSTSTIASESKDLGLWNQKPKAIRKAWAILPKIENNVVREQTEDLLVIIGLIIGTIQDVTGGNGRIPPLHAHILDDKSVIVEWIVGEFRIGFNIESNPEESGWHYITSKRMGERTASGPLDDKKAIIRLLVDILVKSV